MLRARRGVKRCRNDRSSNDLRMPSIQPQHNATSIACALVTVGRPDPFLCNFSQISVSRAWLAFIHATNAASVRKLLIFAGSGTTGAIVVSLAGLQRTVRVEVDSRRWNSRVESDLCRVRAPDVADPCVSPGT